ncbi:MAG: hypothetical protein JWO73_907 [Candidatus Taylorbacteria bacterium]|nr:hypothetical protein [Candidatus Taylorbacteria bacterium]
MPSIFPAFFTYGLIAPLLLRLVLGAVLALWGLKNVQKKTAEGKAETQTLVLGIVDLVSGVLLIIGLFTQAAALVAVILLGVKLVNKATSKALFTDGVNYYFILFVIAISILFSGAGFLAFDLPL